MKDDILKRLENLEGYTYQNRQNILSDAYNEIEELRDALRDLFNRCQAHGCEKWFPHVMERAAEALKEDKAKP